MSKFYSIIKISPNTAVGDAIAIGVLLFDGEHFRYFFSKNKKSIALKLLKNKNIDFIIKQLIKKTDFINKDRIDSKLFYNW